MVRGGVDDASMEHSVSVCSLWSPQGISDRSEGLGPGYSHILKALVFSTGGVSYRVSCGVPSLGGAWVMGWTGISMYGTTCHPPGSLMC